MRGARLTQAEIDRFLLRLGQTQSTRMAAEYAGRSYEAFRKRRQRDPNFRRMWDAAVESSAQKEEEFFENLMVLGRPVLAYAAAGLSPSWYSRRMQDDPAFADRVRVTIGRQIGGLLGRALVIAEDDPAMLRYLIDRLGHGIIDPRNG